MIPFILIGGGAYLIFEALGNNRPSFDPLDYGLPTKGYRGYRKGKSYLASGGKVAYSDPNKFYYYQRFNGAIGGFGWKYDKKYNEGIIYPLDEFDKEYYSHIKLKPDEKLFRYTTDRMQKGDKYLIKMNLEKGLIYFMSDSEDDKNPKFDTKGIKAEYIQLDKSLYQMAKGGTVSNPYADFLLDNGFEKAYEIKKDGFTEYRKGRWYAQINTKTKEIEVGKYTHDWSYAETKKDGGIREDSPFYHSDRYTNNLARFKKFLDDNYVLDEVMARGGKTKKLYAVLRSPLGEIISHVEVTSEDKDQALRKFREMGVQETGSVYFTTNEPYYYAHGGETSLGNGGNVPTEEEINFMRKFPSGTPRKLLSSDEIKMANKLVKKGYMEKGITDDDKKSVMYEIDYSIRKKYLD